MCGPCEYCAEALADYVTIPAYRDALREAEVRATTSDRALRAVRLAQEGCPIP